MCNLSPPPGSVPFIQRLPGYEDIDGWKEVLSILRCGFGLKDALRLWRQELRRALLNFSVDGAEKQASIADPQFGTLRGNALAWLVLSSHVDDLQGAGETYWIEAVIDHLK